MRFSTILALPVLLAASALAGYNCKCQDAAGQYNGHTEQCCTNQSAQYHKSDAHQCTGVNNSLNSGMFVLCCQGLGNGGAYCWA